MKARNYLAVLVGALVVVTAHVPAAFLDVVAERFEAPEWRENGYDGLDTYRLYAVFDGNDDDGVISVFGVGGVSLAVRTYNDWFFNDQLGTNSAPVDMRKGGYWSNLWDTFGTIGAEFSGGDATTHGSSCDPARCFCHGLDTESGGWFVTPDDEQSRADKDGRVLLGQFTVIEGSPGIEFHLNLLLRNGNQLEDLVACTGTQDAGPTECELASCPSDINVDFAVDFADLLVLLGNWGACNGCPADLDCSFGVGFEDLLEVLAAWGPCP